MDRQLAIFLRRQEELKNLFYLAAYEYITKGINDDKLSALRTSIKSSNDEIKNYCSSNAIPYSLDRLLDPLNLLKEVNNSMYVKALSSVGKNRSQLEDQYMNVKIVTTVVEPKRIVPSKPPKVEEIFLVDKNNPKMMEVMQTIKKSCSSVSSFADNIINSKSSLAMLGDPILGIQYSYSQDYVESLIDNKSPELNQVLQDIKQGIIRDMLPCTTYKSYVGRENVVAQIRKLSRNGDNLLVTLQNYANVGILPEFFLNIKGLTYENYVQLLEFSEKGSLSIDKFVSSVNSVPKEKKEIIDVQKEETPNLEKNVENESEEKNENKDSKKKRHFVSKYSLLLEDIKALNNSVVDILSLDSEYDKNPKQKFNDIIKFIVTDKENASNKYGKEQCDKICELYDKINLFLKKHVVGYNSLRIEEIDQNNTYDSIRHIASVADKRKDAWKNVATKGLTTISTLAVSGVMYASPTIATVAATGVAIGADKALKHYEKKHQSKKWYKVVRKICSMVEKAGLGAIISKLAWPAKGIITGAGLAVGGLSLLKAKNIKNLDSEELEKSGKITGIIKKKLNDREFLNSLAQESLMVSGIALVNIASKAASGVLSGATLEESIGMSR